MVVKRKLDPMRIVEVANKRYVYRCYGCGAETPAFPVPLDKLGAAPDHVCPNADRLNIKEIMNRHGKTEV
jgi:hypothetical protein